MSAIRVPVTIRSLFSRRWVRLASLSGIILLTVWVLSAFVLFPFLMESVLSSLNARLNSSSTDSSLSVGGIEPFRGHEIVLKDLRLTVSGRTVLEIPQARLGFSLYEVISGRRIPDYILVEDMAVRLDTDFETWGGLKPLKDRADDLFRGASDKMAREQAIGKKRASAMPDLIVRRSSVSLLEPGSSDSILSLSDIGLVFEYEEFPVGDKMRTWWNIKGDMNLSGLRTVDGGDSASLEMIGRVGQDGKFKLKVASRVPFYAPTNKVIPAVMSLGSFDVRMDPVAGRLSASLGNLSLGGIGPFVDKLSRGRFQIDGELGMDSAVVELRLSTVRDILEAGVEDLTVLSVSGARFTARFPDGRIVSARDFGLKMTPVPEPVPADSSPATDPAEVSSKGDDAQADDGLKPYWVVDFSGLAGSSDYGFSPLSLAGRFSRDMTFIDGHLTTDGQLPIVILSMLHNRLLPWGDTSLSLDVDLANDGQFLKVRGHAAARNISYFLPRLCLVPVTGVSFDTDFDLLVSVSEKVVNASVSSFRTGGMHLSASLEYEFMHAQPAVKVRIDIPSQPCQDVFDSIPPVMVPRLRGARAKGDMSYKVRFDSNPGKTAVFRVDAGLDSCRVVTLGDSVSFKKIMSPRFVHRIIEQDEDGRDVRILTGPGSRSFVPLAEIPVHVQQAALATEDMNFFKHTGFAPGLIKRAILLNMDKGWYVYGGSTITQQLVKNLFLSREKTLSRKLEEAIIVWALEREVPKEKTLELYLNCIEFGFNVYGIKAAAATYFNKTPIELTPLESAFIMATKPNPKSAYSIYRKKVMGKWWVERLEGILKRLWGEMGQISEYDYAGAWPWIPTFWYGEEGVYQKPEIVGKPDVPDREALGIPLPAQANLPVVRLLPEGPDSDDGAENDDVDEIGGVRDMKNDGEQTRRKQSERLMEERIQPTAAE